MSFLLFSMFFRTVSYSDELVAEMRKGFAMVVERLDRMDKKLDKIIDNTSGGPFAPDAGKKKTDSENDV